LRKVTLRCRASVGFYVGWSGNVPSDISKAKSEVQYTASFRSRGWSPFGRLSEEPSSSGLLRCEHVKKSVARDLACAEGGHVRSRDLTIDPGGAALAEMFDEEQQREFGGVGRAVRHRLAGEDAAGIDAVQTANEIAVAPHFQTVRISSAMELCIRGDDLRTNPSSNIIAARRLSARRDD